MGCRIATRRPAPGGLSPCLRRQPVSPSGPGQRARLRVGAGGRGGADPTDQAYPAVRSAARCLPRALPAPAGDSGHSATRASAHPCPVAARRTALGAYPVSRHGHGRPPPPVGPTAPSVTRAGHWDRVRRWAAAQWFLASARRRPAVMRRAVSGRWTITLAWGSSTAALTPVLPEPELPLSLGGYPGCVERGQAYGRCHQPPSPTMPPLTSDDPHPALAWDLQAWRRPPCIRRRLSWTFQTRAQTHCSCRS
jgi:hypothetical protein